MYFPFVILGMVALAIPSKATDYYDYPIEQSQARSYDNSNNNLNLPYYPNFPNYPSQGFISNPTRTTQATLNNPNFQSNAITRGLPQPPKPATSDVAHSETEITESPTLPVRIIHYDPHETWFVSSNQTVNLVNITQWENATHHHPIQFTPEFAPTKHVLINHAHSYIPQRILPSLGFVQTVMESYRNHHTLVIRPDDIWTAILCQWSLYVNAHSEELRNHFVTHNGTQSLVLDLGFRGRTTNISKRQWRRLIEVMKNKLMKEIKNPDWVLNSFSTTEEEDVIVSSVALMSIMQKYFKYDFRVLCGIPDIAILGTLEDWEEILRRVREFRRYGRIPSQWADELTRVIQQFKNTKTQQIDMEFWGDIAKIQTTEMCPGKEGQTIDGWITVFGVFDAKGNWRGNKQPGWKWPRIQTQHLASGVVAVPISISGYGPEINATVFAGHMGHSYTLDRTALQPYTGWVVARNIGENIENPRYQNW